MFCVSVHQGKVLEGTSDGLVNLWELRTFATNLIDP